jgi:1-acyl-sn-glycerol-3-phosphate acyltransferase
MSNETPQRTRLWRCFQTLFRIITSRMFDLKIYGEENLPKTGGALLLANHQSYLDPVVIAVKLTRPVTYMAKTELFESHPLFKWFITNLHAFPVRRGESDVSAIKKAIAKLHEGHILNMYPEGTRSLDGELGRILPGVVVVVRRAQVPVIPVAIDGSFKAWPKGAKRIDSRPVRVMYGKPLQIEGLKSDEILELIDRSLRDMLKQMRSPSFG